MRACISPAVSLGSNSRTTREFGLDGFENVLKDQLFLDLALGCRRRAELLDDGDDVGLLEELGNGGQLERSLLELGKRQRPAPRSELAQAQPDTAECREASGDGRHSKLRQPQENRSRKCRRRSEDRRRREFERQCPADAFPTPHEGKD